MLDIEYSVVTSDVIKSYDCTKQGLMCLSQGHSAVTPLRLKPAIPQSRDKLSSTDSLRFIVCKLLVYEPV